MGANDQDDVPEKLRGWELTPTLQPAFDYVAGYESRGRPDIMNGGKETFDTSGTHPNRVGAGGTSRAAGYTQFIPSTWARVAGEGTTMDPENQKRAFAKYAVTGYKERTGRDLEADIAEAGGITPQIAQVLDANQLGIKSTNGYVLGNVPGGKRASQDQIMGTYKGAKMADNQSDAGSDQIQYGGGQQGPYSKSSRMEEYNIPFQQRAEKAGLLGMLGVQTTPGERMALMKMGATMMTTVGNPLTALGEGIGAYVNETKAQNKAQSDLAGAQQEAKLREAQARQAVSASTATEAKSPLGIISRGADWRGTSNISTTETPEAGKTVPVGGAGGSKSAVNVGGEGQISIDPEALKTVTPSDIANPSSASPKIQTVAQKIKDNFDLGSIYDNSPETVDKENLLKKLAAKPPSSQAISSWDKWQEDFDKQKSAATNAYYAARESGVNLGTYAKALANIPNDGPWVSGAKSNERYALGNVIATAANAAGITDEVMKKNGIDPDKFRKLNNALVAKTEMEKLSANLAREQNPGMQVAHSWLDRTTRSLPSTENQPEANAALLGNLYAARAIAKDNFNVINKFGDMTNQNGYGKTASALQAANKSTNYTKDANMITELVNPANKDMLVNYKGKTYNAVGLYVDGHMSATDFNNFVKQKYGIHNASRIFD